MYFITFSDVYLLSILDSTSHVAQAQDVDEVPDVAEALDFAEAIDVAEALDVDAEPPSIAPILPAPTYDPSNGGNVTVKTEVVKATNQLLICPICGNQVAISSKILL